VMENHTHTPAVHGKSHTHTSALKLSLSYIDLTIFSRNFAQKFQIFVLNSNFT
jgi:hypothetical protein